MKANHNVKAVEEKIDLVVLSCKSTKIWKQITTEQKQLLKNVLLFYPAKVLKFESKSQPSNYSAQITESCFILQKY